MKRATLSILASITLMIPSLTLTSLAASDSSPYTPKDYVQLEHPDWCKNAAIYQVNVRQFSEEGTFAAVQSQLPRIKKLGTNIIWLMPIHKIGEVNRKGSLGSPYSVKDYYSVNPEFGDLDDLKRLVAAAHDLDMRVILDWVANHTAWDNELATKHPEWYERDHEGAFRPTPWWDWSDIIDLDFSQPGVREYMTEALKYWVEEADIDGYRCDVAGFVPLDFWENVRRELDAIKPVFLLAEWESRDLHANAFDMTYAWSWNQAVHKICKGDADLNALFVYYSWNESAFPPNSIRMTYTSNHDQNAWEGTMFEQFGDGLENAIALSVVGEGLPLIYNGQEAGNDRRLAFFEKDPIEWQTHPIGDLYTKLIDLMKENTALWHGNWGAPMNRVPNSAPSEVLSFVRENETDKVFAVFNFSDKTQKVSFQQTHYHGDYTQFSNGSSASLTPSTQLDLAPWTFEIFIKETEAAP